VLPGAKALVGSAQPLTQMAVFRIGQGVAAVADDATAFSHRDADHVLHPITMWQDAADDARLIAASHAFSDTMRPFSSGRAYLNFTAEDRVRDAYGAAKYARLVALKDRYDPDNLFMANSVETTWPCGQRQLLTCADLAAERHGPSRSANRQVRSGLANRIAWTLCSVDNNSGLRLCFRRQG
jgi:hypothetical protein